MDKELCKIAAQYINDVYKLGHLDYYNVGSTEWIDTIADVGYKGKPLQILAIGGSDEMIDWFWNAALASLLYTVGQKPKKAKELIISN